MRDVSLLFGALLCVGVAAPIWLHGPKEQLPLLLGAVALVGVVMAVAIRRFLGRQIEFAEKGARLLDSGPGRSMLARLTMVGDFTGALMELWAPGADEAGPLWGLASVRGLSSGRRLRAPKGRFPVRMWQRAFAEGPDIALEHEGLVFIGRKASFESLAASWRWMKLLFLGLAGLGVGVAILGVALASMRIDQAEEELALARASREWPRAEGVVLASQVEETRIPKGKTSVPGWRASIHYRYTVAGAERESRRIAFGYEPTLEAGPARALVETYPTGGAARPYYDPRDPARAALEPGMVEDCSQAVAEAKLLVWVILGMSALVTAIPGVALAWMGAKRRTLLRRVGFAQS